MSYNILIAPDSFKGTLTASEVCDIIEKAFQDTIENVNIEKLPVADGGEGLCSCFETICGGRFIKAEAAGVFGEKMYAEYLMLPDNTAVIETASCAGLPLAGKNKNPLKATTYGLGELIRHAENEGAKSILLGLGGSATNDCGCGMAAALGWKFYDNEAGSFVPVGGTLCNIKKLEKPSVPFSVPVTAACDVENPLYGPDGAAYVFAPQKGADANTVKILDNGLKNISDVIRSNIGIDVSSLKGAGAAGGLGAGTVAFLGGKLEKGIDIILDKTGFNGKVKNADLVITGEGKLDSQSVNGKVISGIAERSKAAGKPVFTICGCRGNGAEKAKEIGVNVMFFSLNTPKPFEDVLRTCREDLYAAAVKAAQTFAKHQNCL